MRRGRDIRETRMIGGKRGRRKKKRCKRDELKKEEREVNGVEGIVVGEGLWGLQYFPPPW